MTARTSDMQQYQAELRVRVGAPQADRITECNRKFAEQMRELENYHAVRNQTDKAAKKLDTESRHIIKGK